MRDARLRPKTAIDDVTDTMIAIHDRLQDTEWQDLVEHVPGAVAEVDNLPMGNGADSRLERLRWAITPGDAA